MASLLFCSVVFRSVQRVIPPIAHLLPGRGLCLLHPWKVNSTVSCPVFVVTWVELVTATGLATKAFTVPQEGVSRIPGDRRTDAGEDMNFSARARGDLRFRSGQILRWQRWEASNGFRRKVGLFPPDLVSAPESRNAPSRARR